MRITIVTAANRPDTTAGNLSGLSRYLARQGWQVTFVSLGEPADQTEDIANLRRISGGDPNCRVSSAARLFHRLSRLRQADVLLVHCDATLSAAAATMLRAAIPGTSAHPRLVYLIDRLTPDPRAIAGRSALWSSAVHACKLSLTGMMLRRANAIIVAGEDMQQTLRERYGPYICSERVSVIRPWFDGASLGRFDPGTEALTQKLGTSGLFTVVHHGTLGAGHDAQALAQAIELTSPDASIVWLLTGDGPRPGQLNRGKRRTADLRNVRYVPPDSACTPWHLVHLGDAHVISQAAHLTGTVCSARLPQVMAAGKPVIAVADDRADCAHIVRDHRAGFAVPSGHGEILARHVWQLRDSAVQRRVMGLAARAAFEKNMCARIAYPAIERILAD